MQVKWRFDPLAFESGVFDAPVGRVVLAHDSGSGLGAWIQSWIDKGQWLVCARVPALDDGAAQDLVAHHFIAIETLVTLERSLDGAIQYPNGVRRAGGEDCAACVNVARAAFTYDRFHADGRIADAQADALKVSWVSNAVKGRADAVFVFEDKGQVVGFITCMVNGSAAVIDLIAVAPGCQGQGIGKALVQGVLYSYANTQTRVRVGTQITNMPSLALYEGLGFIRMNDQITYHWINEKVRL